MAIREAVSAQAPKVLYFEGRDGLKETYERTLKTKGEIVAYSSSRDMFATIPEYISDYIKRRARLGIPMRSIVPHTPEGHEHKMRALRELRDTRLVPIRFDFSPEINIYDDEVAVMSLKKGQECGVVIKGSEVANAFRRAFELAWESASRYDMREFERENIRYVKRSKQGEDARFYDVASGNFTVEQRVSEEVLEERYEQGRVNRSVGSEQWYRRHENWYATTAYANPYQTVYTELKMLLQHENELKPIFRNSSLIFYGVGTGDTELVPVDWMLGEAGCVEVCAVDVVDHFINGFIQSLRNLNYKYSKSEIMLKAYNALFQQMGKMDFEWANSRYSSSLHICLGNTVGNFEQKEILGIFKNNMKRGDLLVLGIQLNKDIDKVFMQYSKNIRLKRFVLDGASRGFEQLLDAERLKWNYNPEESRIEALLGDVLVFQSRKYDLGRLLVRLEEYGFRVIKSIVDGNTCIGVFERR